MRRVASEQRDLTHDDISPLPEFESLQLSSHLQVSLDHRIWVPSTLR